jgi:hypothetical protein
LLIGHQQKAQKKKKKKRKNRQKAQTLGGSKGISIIFLSFNYFFIILEALRVFW